MPKKLQVHKPAGRPNTTKERHRQFKRDRTDRVAQAFYTSKAWRATRKAFLDQHPVCEECCKDGRTTQAKVVDHLQEVKQRPDLALSFDNLQALCLSHHNAKTGRAVCERR